TARAGRREVPPWPSEPLDGRALGAAARLAAGAEQAVQLLLDALEVWLVGDPLGRRGELLVALAAGAGSEHVACRQADGDAELALHRSIPALSGWSEVSPLAYPGRKCTVTRGVVGTRVTGQREAGRVRPVRRSW